MQQVDKNGTKTILRLNEVVSKRRKSNSLSSSSYRLKESDVSNSSSTVNAVQTPASSSLNITTSNSSQLTMSTSTISDICNLSKNLTTTQTNKLASPILVACSDKQRKLEAPTAVEAHSHNMALFDVQDKRLQFLVEFTAGALGGALSRTATAPIDRLRTVFQVQSVEIHNSNLTVSSVWRYMILEGKWQSLWRGNLVNVVKTAPENAIRMASYEKLKQVLVDSQAGKQLTIGDKFFCGGFAGLISTLTLYPLKTVKTLMNLGSTGEFKSIADCVNQTFKKHGMRAFYRGLLANSIAIMPATGIDLATYETLKKSYSRFANKSEPTVVEKIIIGNISASLGNLFVYPLLFARTRLQSNRNPSETTTKIIMHVIRKDGIAGVYRGFLLHVLKIGPAASISYVTFESFTKLFNLNSLSG